MALEDRAFSNMPGNTGRFSSVVGDVKAVVTDVSNLMKSAVRDSATLVSNLSSAVGGYRGSKSSSGGSGPTVMNQPTPAQGEQGNGNGPVQVMNQPGSGGGGSWNNKFAGSNPWNNAMGSNTAAALALGATALPGTQTLVAQNLFATRNAFYGYGNGGIAQRYDQAQNLQSRAMGFGTATNTLDASRAMATGQSLGIGVGLKNYDSLMMGAAGMSNLTPGVGLEGSMGAYASLQRPQTVNLLRMSGIMTRDPLTGQLKSYTEIADQLWRKLTAEKSTAGSITKDDLAQAALPGNSLDILLNAVAGNDPILRQQLMASLYAKAGGAKNYSREEAVRTGASTKAVSSQANRTAKSFDTVAQTSRSGAAGYEAGNNFAAAVSQFSNAVDSLTGFMKAGTAGSGFMGTVGGMGNGIISKVLGFLGLNNIPGMAEGGDPKARNAYMVGERGPELFVPETNGTIIPNHKLNFAGFRHEGGPVHSHGKEDRLSDNQLNSILLNAGFSKDQLSTAVSVIRAESGGDPTRLNPNANTGDYSMGLFQINMIGDLGKRRNAQYLEKYGKYGYKGPESLYDPAINARIAYDISKGGNKWDAAWVNTSKKLGLTSGAKTTTDQGGQQFSGLSGSAATSTQSYADMVRAANPQAAQTAWGQGGGGSTHNYGGVTINIVADKDPKKTAAAISEVFSADQLARKAAQS
jgi:hypothetical protein